MRIAICDDCAEDVQSIKKYLVGQEVGIYFDADTLLAEIEDQGKRYDLYLLDIFMESSVNGIEQAKKLRLLQEEAFICFISTSDDFYREAYDLYAVQYLIKPVQEESIKQLLKRVEKEIAKLSANKEKNFIYSRRGKSGMIPYGKIRYISSSGHTIFIYCTDGKIQESTGKLSDIERQLCGNTFLRCHQSFIVNVYHVEGLKGSEFMVGGEWVPISRRYYAEVKKRYQEMLFEGVE
ncbi:MAG: LytTR family DNA-binding domain-containing protein [Lachnospiraceae bacterium]|nr:LytTR family DNA-binding domain-containing protein [Lachnospiraceae bacterium]